MGISDCNCTFSHIAILSVPKFNRKAVLHLLKYRFAINFRTLSSWWYDPAQYLVEIKCPISEELCLQNIQESPILYSKYSKLLYEMGQDF